MNKFKVGDKFKRPSHHINGDKVLTVSKINGPLIYAKEDSLATVAEDLNLVSRGHEMENPKTAKFGVNWMEDEDPTLFFETEEAEQSKIEELLKNDDVDKDSIYMFEVSNVKHVETPISFRLVDVVKKTVKKAVKPKKK